MMSESMLLPESLYGQTCPCHMSGEPQDSHWQVHIQVYHYVDISDDGGYDDAASGTTAANGDTDAGTAAADGDTGADTAAADGNTGADTAAADDATVASNGDGAASAAADDDAAVVAVADYIILFLFTHFKTIAIHVKSFINDYRRKNK